MTIEQLLECNSEQLNAMTDAQLEEYFKPYLTATRPEMVRIEKAKQAVNKPISNKQKSNAEQREFLLRVEHAKKLALEKGITLNL